MKIEKFPFGMTKYGEDVYKFSLSNKKKTRLEIINYGASIISFILEDQDGNCKDIVLGYDKLIDYEKGEKYFGATIGRYANRIKDSQFQLNGKTYKLNPNEGKNQLHGGNRGFQKRVWDYEIKDESIIFKYISEDGEEGYPGTCTLEVEYSLNDEDEVHINYTGSSDKDTLLNPTSHSYFNLDGHDRVGILDHYLEIDANYYLPKDGEGIPLGEVRSVKDTPFDFRKSKKINTIFQSNDEEKNNEEIKESKGIDHNFCLNSGDLGNSYFDEEKVFEEKIVKLAASIYNSHKTLKLLCYTDLPGLQVYTGNFIQGERGKYGVIYSDYSGIALEPQFYPNSINEENFQSPILKAGETFTSTTIYKLIKKI